MAKDVITRFRLETTQFDSKIKSAAKGLSEYTKSASNAGKEFQKFTKDNVAAAQALGKMATSSQDAKGKVNELVGAFNEAAKAYNALTKEQQQSDFGKAMAASLTQLQQRIRETKAEMQSMGNVSKSMGGGFLSGIGSKMEGALAVFGGNLMTKAAGAVAQLGSEMADMVKQGVELAKQGEGIRIAFERLGRGDILDGLRQATHGTVTDIELMKAAVKFNDFKLPLDELGTMLAFAQQKAKDTGQSVDYMVDSIVTGLGRKSLMILDNLGLSATEVKDKMKETGDMTKAVGAIIREQMAKAGDYVETAADRAAQANVSLQNKMEELGRKFAPLEEASNNFWTSMKIGILDVVGGPLARLLNGLTEAGRMMNAYGKIGGSGKVGRMTANLAGASEGNRQSVYQQQQAQFWKYINPREQQIKDIRAWQSGERNEALQKRIGAITEKYGSLDATKIQAEVDAAKKMLSDYQAAAKQILQPIEQKIVPTFGDGGSGGKGGRTTAHNTTPEYIPLEGSIDAQTKKVQDLQKAWRAAADDKSREDIKKQIDEAQRTLDLMTGKIKAMPKIDIKFDGLAPSGLTGKARTPEDLQQGAVKMKQAVQLEIDQEASKVDAETLKTLMKDAIQNGIDGMDLQFGALGDKIGKGIDIPDDSWQGILDQYNALREMIGEEPIVINFETGKIDKVVKETEKLKKTIGTTAQVVGTIGQAFNAIEDPAAKVAGTVAQAIANIAMAYSDALAKDQTTKFNIWGFIAAAAASTISMATTIAQIHSQTGYAEGGIVKGNTYSGDMIPANGGSIGLNAGEVVLNRAQSGVLASQLEGSAGGFRNGQIVGRIEGEKIVLVANRYFRRTGQGEILTWK